MVLYKTTCPREEGPPTSAYLGCREISHLPAASTRLSCEEASLFITLKWSSKTGFWETCLNFCHPHKLWKGLCSGGIFWFVLFGFLILWLHKSFLPRWLLTLIRRNGCHQIGYLSSQDVSSRHLIVLVLYALLLFLNRITSGCNKPTPYLICKEQSCMDNTAT